MKSITPPFCPSIWRAMAFLVFFWSALLGVVSKSSAITLAWDEDPTDDVQGYRVHYGTTSGIYPITVDTGGEAVAQITNLLPNTTYYFVVTAYNAAGLESLPSEEISYTTPSDPLADGDTDGLPDVWESLHGLNAQDTSGVNGALGDLDQDGVSNLVEYAFNLDPQSPGVGGVPRPVLSRNVVDGQLYLVISFPKRLDDPRLTYQVQSSANLQTWAPATTEEAAPPVVSTSGDTALVSIRILPAIDANSGGTFVRVNVGVAAIAP